MKKPKIFTTEVLASIPVMVAQGMRSGEIADKLGCTPSTLTVRCSQHGISLRRNVRRQRACRLLLSKNATYVLHKQAAKRSDSVDALIKTLLETIASKNLFDVVLDREPA